MLIINGIKVLSVGYTLLKKVKGMYGFIEITEVNQVIMKKIKTSVNKIRKVNNK